MRAVRALGLTLAFTVLGSGAAIACVPPADWSPEREQQADDAQLIQANFIYRAVIEDPQPGNGEFPEELSEMRIRRTQLLWGSGAPPVVTISEDDFYYARCARGNLHPTVQLGGQEPGWPTIRDGLGVTVIGRISDDPPDLFILVDGAPGTKETLRRFAHNLRNLER